MSRPQVTITLGRSGQVVKRAGNSLNNSRAVPPLPKSGSKRSIKERLGGKADNLLHGSVKRRRAESDIKSLNGAGDLRMKLMQRNKTRQASGNVGEHDHINPHVNTPRTVHFPMSSYTHTLEPKPDRPLRQIPPTRSAEDLFELNSMRKSYSSWTHDGLQHESPDRTFRVSRGLSPPRPINGQRELLTYRPIDAPRVPTQVVRDVYGHAVAGPRSSSHFVTRTPLPLDSARSQPRLHTQGAISHRSVYAVQGALTVGAFLNSLGLGKYAIHFQAEEVSNLHLALNKLKKTCRSMPFIFRWFAGCKDVSIIDV